MASFASCSCAPLDPRDSSNLLCKCSLGWSVFWTLELFCFKSYDLLLREKCELAQQRPNNSIGDADKKLVEIEDRCFGLI